MDNPTGSHKSDKTGSMIDEEGSTTSEENVALLHSLDARRETYIRRANELRTLINQQHNVLLEDINRRYIQEIVNNTTIAREEITTRASLLMVMRQHWNQAVYWHLGQDYAADLLGRQERVRAVEQSLMAVETTAVELDSRTRVSAPGGQLNAESVMQRIHFDIPEEFLDMDQQELFRQQEQGRELFQQQQQEELRLTEQRLLEQQEQLFQQHQYLSQQQQHPSGQQQQQSSRQQQQQQQRTLLQRGLDSEGRELFPGSSAGPLVAYFSPPSARRPDPTAGDRGPIAEEQEQSIGEQEHGTSEQEHGTGGQEYGGTGGQGPYYRRARSESE